MIIFGGSIFLIHVDHQAPLHLLRKVCILDWNVTRRREEDCNAICYSLHILGYFAFSFCRFATRFLVVLNDFKVTMKKKKKKQRQNEVQWRQNRFAVFLLSSCYCLVVFASLFLLVSVVVCVTLVHLFAGTIPFAILLLWSPFVVWWEIMSFWLMRENRRLTFKRRILHPDLMTELYEWQEIEYRDCERDWMKIIAFRRQWWCWNWSLSFTLVLLWRTCDIYTLFVHHDASRSSPFKQIILIVTSSHSRVLCSISFSQELSLKDSLILLRALKDTTSLFLTLILSCTKISFPTLLLHSSTETCFLLVLHSTSLLLYYLCLWLPFFSFCLFLVPLILPLRFVMNTHKFLHDY